LPKGPKIQLHVTQDIIDSAQARNSTHCLIAEALAVARPEAKNISVDLATIRYTDPKKGVRFTYLTPRTAQVCIVNFDQGKPSTPFSLQLRGAMVTRSGSNKIARGKQPLTEAQKEQRRESGLELNAKLGRTRLQDRNEGNTVPDRVGGKTPPLQKDSDDLPFSRRRAFGLRGLEY
jgi:hypothetical protein